MNNRSYRVDGTGAGVQGFPILLKWKKGKPPTPSRPRKWYQCLATCAYEYLSWNIFSGCPPSVRCNLQRQRDLRLIAWQCRVLSLTWCRKRDYKESVPLHPLNRLRFGRSSSIIAISHFSITSGQALIIVQKNHVFIFLLFGSLLNRNTRQSCRGNSTPPIIIIFGQFHLFPSSRPITPQSQPRPRNLRRRPRISDLKWRDLFRFYGPRPNNWAPQPCCLWYGPCAKQPRGKDRWRNCTL